MRRILMLFPAIGIILLSAGCQEEINGGFIQEAYSGTIEDFCLKEDGGTSTCYLIVDVGETNAIPFAITESSRLEGGDSVSIGDGVEIKCVRWYSDPNERSILTITALTSKS